MTEDYAEDEVIEDYADDAVSEVYARVYIGAELSPKETMDLFGPKYDTKRKRTCPKDRVPNTNRRNFCGKCGTDLRYKKKVAEGIKDLDEVEKLPAIKQLGLEAYALREDSNGKDGVIIGKSLMSEQDVHEEGAVIPLECNVAQTFEEVYQKLSQLMVNKPVRMYFIATAI